MIGALKNTTLRTTASTAVSATVAAKERAIAQAMKATATTRTRPEGHRGMWFTRSALPPLGPNDRGWKITTVSNVYTNKTWKFSWKYTNPIAARAAINALIRSGRGELAKIEVTQRMDPAYRRFFNRTDVVELMKADKQKAIQRGLIKA